MSNQLSEVRPGNLYDSGGKYCSLSPFAQFPFPWSLRSQYLGEFHGVKSLKRKLKAGPFPAQQPGWAASRRGGSPGPGRRRAAGCCPGGALSPDPGSSCLQDSFTPSDMAPSLGAPHHLHRTHSPEGCPEPSFSFHVSPRSLSHVPAYGSCGCSPERHRTGRPRGSPRCVCQPRFSCQQVLILSPDVSTSGPRGRTVALLEHF